MADEPILFDLGVEVLRGPLAALEIHQRRTRLHLATLGLGRGATVDVPALKRLMPESFGDVLDALDAMDDPWGDDAEDEPAGLSSKGLVSDVYDL